jgi:hypothetical protein
MIVMTEVTSEPRVTLEQGATYKTQGGWLATVIGRHYTGLGWSVLHHRFVTLNQLMFIRWHSDDGSLSDQYPDWRLTNCKVDRGEMN